MIKPRQFLDIHQDLIEKCKSGDSRAQRKVYELYFKAMYNTSLRILKNATIAEDIMQEAFLTAFEKISTYKGESSFGAWLKRIVINKSLDELKKNRPLFEPVETSMEALKIEDEHDQKKDQQVEVVQKVELIKKALAKLSDGYRVVLSLHLFEGYDYEEIAQILGITESTVRSQFARARLKLLEIVTLNYDNDELG